MDNEIERWKAVGRAVRERRLALHFDQKTELAEAAGVSVQTITNFENGGRLYKDQWTLPAATGSAAVKVARALSWPPDALARLLEGESPAVLNLEGTIEKVVEVPVVGDAASLAERVASLERVVVQVQASLQDVLDLVEEMQGSE